MVPDSNKLFTYTKLSTHYLTLLLKHSKQVLLLQVRHHRCAPITFDIRLPRTKQPLCSVDQSSRVGFRLGCFTREIHKCHSFGAGLLSLSYILTLRNLIMTTHSTSGCNSLNLFGILIPGPIGQFKKFCFTATPLRAIMLTSITVVCTALLPCLQTRCTSCKLPQILNVDTFSAVSTAMKTQLSLTSSTLSGTPLIQLLFNFCTGARCNDREKIASSLVPTAL